MHLKNIFSDGDLEEDETCKDFLQVQIAIFKLIKKRRFSKLKRPHKKTDSKQKLGSDHASVIFSNDYRA